MATTLTTRGKLPLFAMKVMLRGVFKLASLRMEFASVNFSLTSISFAKESSERQL